MDMDIQKTIVSELRKTKISLRRIGKETGLTTSIVCRAKQGQTVGGRTANKLLTYFGYTLCKVVGKPKQLQRGKP
jgi:hypothetical protein